MSEMFCFQCQQTAGNSGCVRTGVCGKQPKTANLQDYLVCSLIHLAEIYAAKEDYPPEVTHLLADGLFATLTNVNFDDTALQGYIRRAEKLTPQRLPIQDPSWLWRGGTDGAVPPQQSHALPAVHLKAQSVQYSLFQIKGLHQPCNANVDHLLFL